MRPTRSLRLAALLVVVGCAVLPAAPARAGVNIWTGNGPDGGGTFRDLAIDPSNPATVYAASSGSGVFKSLNGGVSWNVANFGLTNLNVGRLAIDPASPSTIYANAFDTVFKSTNGGASWSGVRLSGFLSGLAIDPVTPTTVYAVSGLGQFGSGSPAEQGVFKSTNGGASFSQATAGLTDLNVVAIAIDPISPATVYVGTYGSGVFKSTDGAASWAPVNTGLGGLQVTDLAIDPATPTTLYAAIHAGGVSKSVNGGASWTPMNVGLGPANVTTLAIDPSNPATVYAGIADPAGCRGVFRTTDGGATWAERNNIAPAGGTIPGCPNHLAIDPAAPATVYSAGAGVFKTLDGGANWTAFSAGLRAAFVSALAVSPSNPTLLYASTNGGGFKSVNGGASWILLPSSVTAGALAIDPRDGQVVYVAFFDGIAKSTDGGATWRRGSPGLTRTDVRVLAIVPSAPDTLYAGTGGGVFKTTNGGATWAPAGAGLPAVDVQAIAIDPVTPTTLYVGLDGGGVFKSTDGGASWAPSNQGLTSLGVTAIALDPTNPAVLYAATGRHLGFYFNTPPACDGVFKSTDAGATWTPRNSPATFPVLCIRTLAIDPAVPATVYQGTGGSGVGRSADGGATWQPMIVGLPSLQITVLAIEPVRGTVLYAGTIAASAYDFQIGSAVLVLGTESGPSGGGVADGRSAGASVSADGRFLAFESEATNLDPSRCASGVSQVYVRDRTAGTVTCVSVGPGDVAGNGPSRAPAISSDGSAIVFESEATNLVPGCANGSPQVYARLLPAGPMACVSATPGGAPGNAPSRTPDVDATGAFVVFESMATNLAPGCTGGIGHVFVRDRGTGAITCASVGPGGVQNDVASVAPKISADGTTVVFESMATNLAPGCANGFAQIYVRNLVARTTACASVGPSDVPGTGASRAPDVSGDGTLVVFESGAGDLAAPCRTGVVQVFLRDLLQRETRCLTVGVTGVPGDGPSGDVAISDDGRTVAFATQATNLGVGGGGASGSGSLAARIARAVAPDVRQIIARDISREPVASRIEDLIRLSGSQSGDSRRPALSRDGRLVAFESVASASGGGGNTQTEIQVVDRRAPLPTGRPVIIAPATRSTFTLAPGSALALSWTTVPNAAQYGIEFTGPNRAFSNPNAAGPDPVNGFGGAGGALPASGTTLTVPLTPGTVPPGTYQLRVIALSAAGAPGGTFSDAVTVVLSSGSGAVDRPVILSPAAGTLDRGATVTFSWTSVAGAGQYLFEFTGPGGAFANPNGTGPDPANGFGSPTGGGLPVASTGFTAVVPPIPPGVYQVRVLGFSGTTPVGLASDALTLTVR